MRKEKEIRKESARKEGEGAHDSCSPRGKKGETVLRKKKDQPGGEKGRPLYWKTTRRKNSV